MNIFDQMFTRTCFMSFLTSEVCVLPEEIIQPTSLIIAAASTLSAGFHPNGDLLQILEA